MSIPFEDFWNKYPRRKSRLTAERAWSRLRVKEKELAMESLNKYQFSQEECYIPYPATYLNQKRWTDVQEKEKETIDHWMIGVQR